MKIAMCLCPQWSLVSPPFALGNLTRALRENGFEVKQYDINICDLWAMPRDITQDHKTKLLNNYSNNLKSGGKIIIPISGETLN